MTAILILLASAVAGVLAYRVNRKRGQGKRMCTLGAAGAGALVLAVGALMFGPQDDPAPMAKASASAVSTAPASSGVENPIPPRGQLDDGGPSGLDPPVSASVYAAPRYATLTTESRSAARSYIAHIDAELESGVTALPTADLQVAGDFSRRFEALADAGMTQFGHLSDPLGFCALAGAQAQQLWLSKLVTHDPTPADIQQAATNAQDYREYRARCLATARG